MSLSGSKTTSKTSERRAENATGPKEDSVIKFRAFPIPVASITVRSSR